MQGLGLVAQTRLQVEEKLDGHDPKMRAILQTDDTAAGASASR